MAKLTKKEKEKIQMQMSSATVRTATWVGIRPSVMKNVRKDKKARRVEGKSICRNYAYQCA